MPRRPIIAVIGSGDASPEMEAAAEQIGRGIIGMGARLVTGARGGVMAAASRGARSAPEWREGDVLGVLPGYEAEVANPWVDIVLPTGLGHARNMVVVSAASAVVLLGGEAGSLSEAALARKLGVPVIAVDSTGGVAARLEGVLGPRQDIETASSAVEAVKRLRMVLQLPDA